MLRNVFVGVLNDTFSHLPLVNFEEIESVIYMQDCAIQTIPSLLVNLQPNLALAADVNTTMTSYSTMQYPAPRACTKVSTARENHICCKSQTYVKWPEDSREPSQTAQETEIASRLGKSLRWHGPAHATIVYEAATRPRSLKDATAQRLV